MESKQQRADVRNKSLHIKRSKYQQSCSNDSQVEATELHLKRDGANPHRNARTLMRTFLSKGVVENHTDVPKVMPGGCVMKWKRRKRTSDHPSVKFTSFRSIVLRDGFEFDVDTLRDEEDEHLEVPLDSDTDGAVQHSETPRREGTRSRLVTGPQKEPEQDDARQEEPESPLLRVIAELSGLETLLAPNVLGSSDSVAAISQAVVEKGAVAQFLIALEENLESERAQSFGCRILAVIVASRGDTRCASRAALVALSAMSRHAVSADVQLHGLHTLKAAAANNPMAQEAITAASGLPVVLAAMRTHASSAALQVAGLGVLRNLAMSTPNDINAKQQMQIASAGGFETVLCAMSAQRHESAVQVAGSWALACLTSRNPATQSAAASQGAPARVVEAMEAHRELPALQEAACWAIKEMVTGRELVVAWSDQVRAVSKALREHRADAVQKAGRMALRKLATRTPVPVHATALPFRSAPQSKRPRMTQSGMPAIQE